MSMLQLIDLNKTFENATEPVVKGINLEIESGELIALLGASGCGKTTTLRLIAGLIPASSGDIRIADQSVNHLPPEQRGVAMVFQKPFLFTHLNVFENVAFGLRMRSDTDNLKARVTEMLEMVRLPHFESRRPHQLSGGQEQRVALARALITKPKVLLLDEPFSALDANLRLEMRKLMLHCQRELGTTTVFVTHDQEEAVMLADQIALMIAGRVRQCATPEAIFEQPRDETVARFMGGVNFVDGIKRGRHIETALGRLEVLTHCPNGPVRLTIRPEAMRMVNEPGMNTVQARITKQSYLGTHKRCCCNVNGLELQFNAETSSRHAVNEEVFLQLPTERLWTLETR